MRLIELKVDRLPGIDQSFQLQPAAGINLVLGPNGSGKSSVCRAVEHLLWAEKPGNRPFSVRAVFESDKSQWTVAREDRNPPIWARNNSTVSAPILPPFHLAQCYRLTLPDLLDEEIRDNDRDLAAAMVEQLAGGYNLPRTTQELFASGPNAGRTERRKLEEARDQVRKLLREQVDLDRRREGLPGLMAELKYVRRAGDRAQILETFRDRVKRLEDLGRVKAILANYPDGVSRVRSEDPRKTADLKKEISQQEEQLADLRSERERLTREMADLDLPSAARSNLDRTGLQDRVNRLSTLQDGCDQVARTHAELQARWGVLSSEADNHHDSLPQVDAETMTRLISLQQRLLTQKALIEELEACQATQQATAGSTGWSAATLSGTALLLGVAGALLWSGSSMSNIGLVGAILAGLALLGWGLHRRGKSADSQADKRMGRELAESRQKLSQARKELRALKDELGLDLNLEDPHLADLLQSTEERRHARRELAGSAAQLAEQEEQLASELAGLNLVFDQLELPPASEARAAVEQCNAFLRRRNDWESMMESDRQAARNEETVTRNLAGRRRDLAEISQRIGLKPDQDPTDLATHLLADLPDWTQAVTTRDEAQRDIDQQTADLDRNLILLDGFDPAELTLKELNERIDSERDAAATVEDLVRRRTELEAEIAHAEKDGELARAMVTQEERLQDLAGIRAAVQEEELGRLLCEDVLAQQDTDADSPLLKTARSLFSDFTGGRYSLRATSGPDEDPFMAEDSNLREDRRLSELSDGARTQLMLAVRVAFLTHAENGPRPPLFLDQTLAASDPVRFHTIAGILGRIARDQGRQIFYMSCDPMDQEAWNRALREEGLEPVHVIDLLKERRWSAASPLPALNPPSYEPVPPPGNLSPADYGALLQVPGIDPWAPEDNIHLFHLLRGDLPQLHRLLTAGLHRLGAWRGQRQHLIASGTQSTAQADRLENTGRAFGAFLDSWRHGRGRPVASDWIREQDIFTKQKLPEVLELNREVGGNATLLMTGLREKKVKNLKTEFKNRFEEALTLAGCLDLRACLTEDEQLLQVRRAVTASLVSGTLTSEEVRKLVGQIRHAVNSSGSGSAGN